MAGSKRQCGAGGFKIESHLSYYKRVAKEARPYYQWQFEQFKPFLGRRVADVGCGVGNFVRFLMDKELYLGFEPDKELAEELLAQFRGNNIRLAANGDITKPETLQELKDNDIDTILCVNVLEHIEDDASALANMIHGIKTGGHIGLLVPAFQYLYGSFDELDHHYRRYSKKSLLDLIRKATHEKVEIIRCYYFNFFGAMGWFWKGKILREKILDNKNYRIMNKILPLVSFTEKYFKPPFGMSLVAVLKK